MAVTYHPINPADSALTSSINKLIGKAARRPEASPSQSLSASSSPSSLASSLLHPPPRRTFWRGHPSPNNAYFRVLRRLVKACPAAGVPVRDAQHFLACYFDHDLPPGFVAEKLFTNCRLLARKHHLDLVEGKVRLATRELVERLEEEHEQARSRDTRRTRHPRHKRPRKIET